MAVISVNVLGGDHEMHQEAARLQAILLQSREDAMLQGRDVGMRARRNAATTSCATTPASNAGTRSTDDPLLRARSLPEGLRRRCDSKTGTCS